jgi:methionyl-tRNA formyltransferase
MVNIIFMGTPEFAVPSLERIHSEFGVNAVVTVPDKPQGRGKHLTYSAIKKAAQNLNLPILQPESLKDETFVEHLKTFEPDIIIVVAFRILPPIVYNLAKLGAFNIHASLLPRYRGAAPINWAIINGEKVTGLTSFLLQEEVDTGNILLQKRVNIPRYATAGDLHDLLMYEAATMASETCSLLIKGNFQTIIQDNSLASTAPKIFREQCKIDWSKKTDEVCNFIHGTSPVPTAWTIFDNKILKIYRVKHFDDKIGIPGYYQIYHNNFYVSCNNGRIQLIEVQLESKKRLSISEFIRGYRGQTSGHFS